MPMPNTRSPAPANKVATPNVVRHTDKAIKIGVAGATSKATSPSFRSESTPAGSDELSIVNPRDKRTRLPPSTMAPIPRIVIAAPTTSIIGAATNNGAIAAASRNKLVIAVGLDAENNSIPAPAATKPTPSSVRPTPAISKRGLIATIGSKATASNANIPSAGNPAAISMFRPIAMTTTAADAISNPVANMANAALTNSTCGANAAKIRDIPANRPNTPTIPKRPCARVAASMDPRANSTPVRINNDVDMIKMAAAPASPPDIAFTATTRTASIVAIAIPPC